MSSTSVDALCRARVQAGAAWLDENAPADWPTAVKLNQFDLTLPCRCVLGMVVPAFEDTHGRSGWGTFVAGASAVVRRPPDLSDDPYAIDQWLVDHGFDVGEDEGEDGYKALQAEWVQAIKERQAH